MFTKEVDKTVEQPEMSSEATRKLRTAAARLKYLAQHRPDIATASCVLSRAMARLSRVTWYLRAHPLCRLRFPWQEPPKGVTVYTDSDWASDKTPPACRLVAL